MYYRNPNTQKKLRKAAQNPHYRCGVYYDKDTGRFQKYSLPKKEYRRASQKEYRSKMRALMDNERYEDINTEIGGHHKVTEYWWRLF